MVGELELAVEVVEIVKDSGASAADPERSRPVLARSRWKAAAVGASSRMREIKPATAAVGVVEVVTVVAVDTERRRATQTRMSAIGESE